MSRVKQPDNTCIEGIQELTRFVKVLQNNELNLFDYLYTGIIPSPISKKINTTDEERFTTVKEVIDSTNDENERASRLINLVIRLENKLQEIIKKKEFWVFNESENLKINNDIEKKFIEIFDASLIIYDAKNMNLIQIEQLENCEKILEKYIKWTYTPSIIMKLPEFNIKKDIEADYSNVAVFQQLFGKLAPNPIANQIKSFSLLEWQKSMFMKLKDGFNVICCAPTSSGKTMIALGFIYTFLKYRPKSLLIYIAPNNVLAMEISAILNKYVPYQVSTLLDSTLDRKMNERVVVTTPTGIFTHELEKIPSDSFLVVDEVHCIGNKDGVKNEFCLRKFSYVQTLILSATMTQNTINKLRSCIRNSMPIHEINESTRFMIPQYYIPKFNEDNIELTPLNPVGSINFDDLFNPDLDIPMTPRDIVSLYIRVFKSFQWIIPEYLHPIRFFFIHNSKKPDLVCSLQSIQDNEEESGFVRRLNLDDYASWQKAIFDFLAFPSENIKNDFEGNWEETVKNILENYKLSLTDESTCECSLENSFKLIENIKDRNMFQALFFFPNSCRAFKYAVYIFQKLSEKPVSQKAIKIDKQKETQIEILKKQLDSLERIKLKKGADVKDIKEKKYDLKNQIYILESSSSSVQAYNSLSEVVISEDDLQKIILLSKKWNSNIHESSPLIQMILYGIGVLSGDMPNDLQVLIRKLYASNIISVLMVTEDCAYGINTPTKTVILSDGFTESQRRQMAGRAGRKGLTTNAWVIYFRLNNTEEAGQKLTDLKGNKITLTTSNKFGPNENNWITKIERKGHPYVLSEEQCKSAHSFFRMAVFSFEHASVLAPSLLDIIIKSTVGQTNRHISVILTIISVTPFNRPFLSKESWAYEFPIQVRNFLEKNGFTNVLPNYLVYQWLTNEIKDLDDLVMEELVEVSKYWTYLFILLKNFFGENEIKLYQQIQQIIITSNIRSSIKI